MPHVLVAGKIHISGLKVLQAIDGITVDYVEDVAPAAFLPHLPGADALLVRTQPVTAEIIATAPRLKVVSRHGVGYDTVDVDALSRAGIPLTIVGDVNSRSVAEHAMMLLLAAAKRAIRADRAVRDGGWDYRNTLEAREIAGKQLLIIGFGRIGRTLAEMAEVFRLAVHVYDPFVDAIDEPAITVEGDLQKALATADFVSIHVPATRRPIIGTTEIAAMKPGAILINTARGAVVDQRALVAALADGRIAGAGLDVFATEPPPGDLALLDFDQVVLSPHLAGLSQECAERMAISAAQNIVDCFNATLDPALVVNARQCGMIP